MWLRIAAAVVGLGLVVLIGTSDLVAIAGDAERAAQHLRDLGPWAFVVYVLSFALLEPFGVVGLFFVIPAAIIWPTWLAFLLSLAGATGAGIVGGAFARFVARDWATARMPAALRRFDQRLAERGLRTVIVVRLLFFLAPPAHWALGLSAVPFPTLVLGSAIGFVPGIFLATLVGGSALDAANSAPPWFWAVVAGGVLLVFVARRRRARSRDDRQPGRPEPG